MTDGNEFRDSDLDDLLSGATQTVVAPSDDLMARIQADADGVLDEQQAAQSAALSKPRPGIFAGLFASLGGWPAMAGLTTATVAGIWIGYASPDALTVFTEDYITIGTNYGVDDFMPSFDNILDEG